MTSKLTLAFVLLTAGAMGQDITYRPCVPFGMSYPGGNTSRCDFVGQDVPVVEGPKFLATGTIKWTNGESGYINAVQLPDDINTDQHPNDILVCSIPDAARLRKCEWMHASNAEPIDVPAIPMTLDERADTIRVCNDWYPTIADEYEASVMRMHRLICEMNISGFKCADPSRYLLGPNEKGEHVCHEAQLEAQ